MLAVGQFLAQRVFRLDVAVAYDLPLAAALAGAALVTAAGHRRYPLVDAPPLEALRSGG